ncbi:MAG: hypothetical protein FLDDKLPJ_03309 [Phycisphaerae bacterium]|nr:hypothetical protein [Phycisphaerae bacterium]
MNPGKLILHYRREYDGQAEIADYHSDGTLARRFVNGTQYVDERVALIEGEAGEADTFYYLLQELFTVTGLVEKNGALAEAAVYDGYGKVRLWDYSPGDFDRDGDVDATDQTTFTTAMGLGAPGTPTPDPSTDLDMDGDTDLTDAGLFNTIKNAGGAVAERFVSSLGNPFHFTGRRLYMLETLPEADATPVANQQLQHNRARHYSPLEGRWLQRDPHRKRLDFNSYEYVLSAPSQWVDASGGAAAPPLPPPPSQPSPPSDDSEASKGEVPAAAGEGCGITIKQTPICLIGGSNGGQWGHTWVDWDGGSADCPPDYIEDEDHKCQKEYVNNIWSVVKMDTGTLYSSDPNSVGKPCSEASCSDIKNCLQAYEKPGEHRPPFCLKGRCQYNCRDFAKDAMSKCCLKRGPLIYVDPLAPFKYCCSDCSRPESDLTR